VLREDLAQPVDLLRSGGIQGQSKVDNACVGTLQAKDQLTKVSVIGYQDALLRVGHAQHVSIRQPLWMVAANSGDVVPSLSRKRRMRVSAF
jgi:hypothetical protein